MALCMLFLLKLTSDRFFILISEMRRPEDAMKVGLLLYLML